MTEGLNKNKCSEEHGPEPSHAGVRQMWPLILGCRCSRLL